MAKDKSKEKAKGARSVPNKHLHARVSFLHQAATFFALREASPPSHSSLDPSNNVDNGFTPGPTASILHLDDNQMDCQESSDQSQATSSRESAERPLQSGLSFHLNSQLRQVARKSQIRLHPTIKRTGCKGCSAVLIEGQTCNKYVENTSKGGRKRQAEVLVLECMNCGSNKRFPIGAKRQENKVLRTGASDRGQEKDVIVKDGASSLPP
ncbi:hypothetical protein M409DRAFT_17453 [Zasmidium cellare ATCC 36951]|uniref:Rpr2-domain-containing protein n=1 Tax=Zasmidium cellare ATCC 36951 TaxID=1080233 RepID=A0A6A6CYE8_ZASCE|nr:uncharacterized protein M409DRAFT_17453 [Zasmidium cellare ATCC 36951]KAF2172214.1 hypothetical protein M409DRAFT_17453 [Zasmidium cellare ATCC 36951]